MISNSNIFRFISFEWAWQCLFLKYLSTSNYILCVFLFHNDWRYLDWHTLDCHYHFWFLFSKVGWFESSRVEFQNLKKHSKNLVSSKLEEKLSQNLISFPQHQMSWPLGRDDFFKTFRTRNHPCCWFGNGVNYTKDTVYCQYYWFWFGPHSTVENVDTSGDNFYER